jgi:hypothetical protein
MGERLIQRVSAVEEMRPSPIKYVAGSQYAHFDQNRKCGGAIYDVCTPEPTRNNLVGTTPWQS